MPTRTFVIEEAGKKRFWDVSWEAGEVEISSGVWGASGRARNRSFTSVGERDAFIEAEVRKVLKKGYVESSALAPVADDPHSDVDRKAAAWRKKFEALVAPAWAPTFGEGVDVHGRVRGPMTLLPHESWPACPSCKRPLHAVLELDRSRLPDKALRAKELVQLFTCESWSNEEATSAACIFDGWLARRHAPAGALRDGPAGRGQRTNIIGWTRFEELPPELDESLGAELEHEACEVTEVLLRGAEDDGVSTWRSWAKASGKAARNVHKLGGFPTFVQECSLSFTRQLFQLECNQPFDVNLGDIGAGHLLIRPSGDIAFFWASH